MLKFRSISFAALLGVFAFVYFGGVYGEALFLLLAILVAFALVRELADMLQNVGIPSFGKTAGLLAALLFLPNVVGFFPVRSSEAGWGALLVRQLELNSTPLIIAAAAVIFVGSLLFSSDFTFGVKRMVASFFVMFGPLPVAWAMFMLFGFAPGIFVWFVLTTKAGDTGAYCAGTLCNRLSGGKNHKIAPQISPNKSVEGTLGGMVLSVAVSLALGAGWLKMPWPEAAALGVLLFWGGFFGDLTESAFKRGCKVKDSGSVLPGMGGVWDVMDSFIYNAPLFICYFFFLW